jgi:hypothetical protein
MRIALCFILTLLFCLPAYAAGQAGTDIAILNAGVGARALGMGSAFTAVADDVTASFWNPAGLSLVISYEITTMQTKLSTDAYLLSYGRKINDHISFGLTGKYLASDMQVTGGQGYGYSITPGILFTINQLKIGAKVDELFNEQKWGTGMVERTPAKLRVGIAYGMQERGKIALDMSQTIRSGYDAVISAGYEWMRQGLALRLGYNNGVTAGAGFVSGSVQLDYAYVTQDALSLGS